MLDITKHKEITIPARGSWPPAIHVFDPKSIWAVNAALTAERPLLIRGEPGVGKSQLARAAAEQMGRAFISEVVHARSECQDLQYNYDAVGRLGEAQTLGSCARDGQDIRQALEQRRFLSPGVLWWTLDWQGAEAQAKDCCTGARRPEKPLGWSPQKGCVLLIDEIDKAEADLPNGLLETLGNGSFTVPFLDEAVKAGEGAPSPLVIITTNEERELPAAFLRRCLVLQMRLPEGKEELVDWLVGRGEVHFGSECGEKVRKEAASQLWEDREKALSQNRPAPGQAEYLDMLRALSRLENNEKGQLAALEQISEFALKKYADERI